MPELPTCECVRGLPPYDRLTAIYQAAAELSGDTSLPDASCVAGVPPFQRFGYIYAAFRVLAGDDTLPSMECVEGEPPVDQVTRIYEAVFAYAADDALLAVDCVQGLPIWRQWHAIYTALYTASGDASLTDPLCVPANFDVLSDVFCAMLLQDNAPQLLNAYNDLSGEELTLVFNEIIEGHEGLTFFADGVEVGLTYVSGEGTTTLTFEMAAVLEGAVLTLDYDQNAGNIVNAHGDPLESFTDFPVTNNVGGSIFLRPGDSFTYLRPGGVDTYLRP